MANLKNVIYISNTDYETLVTTGTVTIGGVELTYDPDNLYITPDDEGSYVLNASTTSSTGAIPFVESGTTKYLHTGTTTVLTGVAANGTATVLKGVKASGTAKAGSETHTHSVTTGGSVSLGSSTTAEGGIKYLEAQGTITGASYTPAGSVTLTANAQTADGRIKYVESITGGSASGTGSGSAAPNEHTHSYNTYSLSGSNASGTKKYMKFTAGTTPPSSANPSHTSTASGVNGGSAVAAVTGYPSFNGGSGSFSATRETSGTGDSARRTLIFAHAHTAATLGTPNTSNAAPDGHKHNYDKTTSISFTAGTAPSMSFDTGVTTDTPYISTMTNGSLSLTTNTNAGTTGKNSGSAVSTISGVSYTAPTATTKYLSGSFGGTAATITPTISAGTTKYFHPSFSGSTVDTGVPSATTSFATGVEADGTATVLTGVKGNGTADAITSITVNATSTEATTAFVQSVTQKYLTLEEE